MPLDWGNLRFNPKRLSSKSLKKRMSEIRNGLKRKRDQLDDEDESSSEKENQDVTEDILLKEKVDKLQKQGRNDRKKIKRRDLKIEELNGRIAEIEEEHEITSGRLKTVETNLQDTTAELENREASHAVEVREALRAQEVRMQEMASKREEELNDIIMSREQEASSALEGKEAYKQRVHALNMKVARFPHSKELAVKKAVEKAKINEWQVKDSSGAIRDDVRALVRDLVAETHLGVEHVEKVIHRVLSAGGVQMIGNMSVRSVGRIVVEGDVASKCQIADDVVSCQGLSISGDGTTHKNLNYESRHIRVVRADGTFQDFSLGVQTAINHTSETQLEGWKATVEDIASTHQRVYGYDQTKIIMDKREFAIKTVGANSDHSDDQKKLHRLYEEWKDECDVEKRGEQSLLRMAPGEVISALLDATEVMVQDAGGWEAWERLPNDEKSAKHQAAYDQLRQKLGRDAVALLPEDEKAERTRIFWVGCGMHKDMNAAKGGDKAMQECIQRNAGSIPAPMKFLNKDNRAAANSGSAEATARANEVSKGGATKLTELAGTIFRNKDTKKGQQDTTQILTECLLGYGIVFPNTSNVRFGSHGDASTVLIVHRRIWMELLEIVKNKKATGTWTNIEQNVYNGLQDNPTIHQLCVLSLYSQSVTHPYLRMIRSTTKVIDGMDLGPVHKKLLVFLRKVINDPDLLLAPDAKWETASFDENLWDSPEAYFAVQQLLPELPFIRQLLVAFFEGALETWERFNEEFLEDGAISRATEAQRSRVSIPATNDLNEGALGSKRRSKRDCPNMSNHAYNARKNYKFNETSEYIESMPSPARKNLRKVAREIDASGLVQQERTKQAIYDADIARKNKGKAEERDRRAAENAEQIKNTTVLPLLELTDKLTVEIITAQLRWHRDHRKKHKLKTRAIPGAKTKADKLEVLVEVARDYWTAKEAGLLGNEGLSLADPILNDSLTYSTLDDETDEEE